MKRTFVTIYDAYNIARIAVYHNFPNSVINQQCLVQIRHGNSFSDRNSIRNHHQK